ncbi:MAG: HD domain-containing phosphohydrolase [Betaproteobacteria bacterium]
MNETRPPTAASAVDAFGELAREAVRVSDLARETIRRSELRYRRLFEAAQDGILLINAETGQIDDVNPFLMKLLDYSYDEFLGKKLWEVGSFKDIQQTKDMFEILQDSGYVRYDDLPLKTRAGVTIDVEFVSNLYEVAGEKVIQCNIRDISERKRLEVALLKHHEQLKIALTNTVRVVTMITAVSDPYTSWHERRVAQLAVAIGKELRFSDPRLEGLKVAGHLHDVGKVACPTQILTKPGKISPIEYQLIQAQAQVGYDILHTMEWPWPVAEVALQHHERMDGTGYPNGLKGDEILLEARIVAAADVVEAMASHRPYRVGLGLEKALAEILQGRGTKYDAAVVDACLKLFNEQGFQLLPS